MTLHIDPNAACAWISAVALASCGIPAAVHAWRTGECRMSWWFLALWLLGGVEECAAADKPCC